MSVKENFNIDDLVRSQRIKVNEAIDKTMLHYKPLIVDMAKTNHQYNNQTWQLTDTTDAVYTNFKNTLTIFAPATSPQGRFYGHDVLRHYNENWLKNAAYFYKKDMEDYFIEEVTN